MTSSSCRSARSVNGRSNFCGQRMAPVSASTSCAVTRCQRLPGARCLRAGTRRPAHDRCSAGRSRLAVDNRRALRDHLDAAAQGQRGDEVLHHAVSEHVVRLFAGTVGQGRMASEGRLWTAGRALGRPQRETRLAAPRRRPRSTVHVPQETLPWPVSRFAIPARKIHRLRQLGHDGPVAGLDHRRNKVRLRSASVASARTQRD